MNSTALKKLLTLCILTALSLSTDANAQSIKPIATFPGGIIFLPTINANNVIIRYTTPFIKEATFYPRGDTTIIQQLDTCKRQYIALSWAFDALEQRHIDSLVKHKEELDKMAVDNSKLMRRGKRKSGFRGFLWGVPSGIILGVLAFVR